MPLFDQPSILQTQFAEISSNTSTTSATFIDFLSITLTTDGETSLLIQFHATGAVSKDNNSADFQLVIDGTPIRGCRFHADKSGGGDTQSAASLVYKQTGLAAGSHTVTIQWRETGGGTAYVRPVTYIYESASLLVIEVTR